jgi:hypothetical protein
MQINIDEAAGRITVEAEGQEPYECSSSSECIEYLQGVMPEIGEAEETDMQAMWDQEAEQRSQPGLMA